MTVSADLADELIALVGRPGVETRPEVLHRLSRDFSWLSPILSRDLRSVPASVAVSPEHTDQVADVLDFAYRRRLAVTPRGAGTSNYGQSVPMAPGIVLDTTRLTGISDIDADSVVVEAGADPKAVDDEHGTPPLSWARAGIDIHGDSPERQELVRYLEGVTAD